jgi:hypothetical protein
MKLYERLSHIDQRLDSHDRRFESLERFMRDFAEAVQLGFLRLEEKMDGHFDRVDIRFSELQQEMHELNRRQGKLELSNEDRADHLLNYEERITAVEVWKQGLAGA